MMRIAAKGLTVGHSAEKVLLRDISFELRRGESLAFVGASGCGKTTLLKTLAGILPLLDGEASVLGTALPSRPPRGKVGYIPQNLGLVQNATVLENVLYGLAAELTTSRSISGVFPEEHLSRARAALAEVGLSHKADSSPRQLSGGEKRRVAIARAIVQRPEVLLADEMFSELDPKSAEEVLAALKRIQDGHGTAIVLVEHNLTMACGTADTIVGLRDGGIVARCSRGEKPECLLEVFYGKS